MNSFPFRFPQISFAMRLFIRLFKDPASLLRSIQVGLRQRPVVERFAKSVSLITGFRKNRIRLPLQRKFLGEPSLLWSSSAEAYGEQALAE